MHRLTLLVSAASLATAAQAEPIGRWWAGFGQGIHEYGIRNDSARADSFYIACPIGEAATIRITVGTVDAPRNKPVIVTIGAEELELWVGPEGYVETNSHVAASTFYALWDLMRSGSAMRVRLSSGQSTAFTLSGSSKVLPKDACETGYGLS